MNESTIGIKVADGTYFPILQENESVKKKLVLTTVNDSQTDVQIDLYKGSGSELADAVYIGSLVIDSIEPAEKGSPEIELLIGLDDEGVLNASAGDSVSGEHQSLSVSLESLGENSYDIPDFELDDDYNAQEGITAVEEEQLSMDSYGTNIDEEPAGESAPVKKRNPLFLAAFVVLGLVIICILAYFALQFFKGEPSPDLVASTDQPRIEVPAEVPVLETADSAGTETQEAESPAAEQAAGSASAGTAAGESEPAAASVPAVEEKPAEAKVQQTAAASGAKGVLYVIRWGDTLWDISSSFYRTPWLYGKIAKDNSIPDPDLIYAGSDLQILENR